MQDYSRICNFGTDAKNNQIFFEGLNLAYNKLLTFGVKQIPISSKDGQGLNWQNLKKLQ